MDLEALVDRTRPPPVIAHAGPLLAKYDALFCDVWGVVHDGLHAFAAAGDALARFRAKGGTVVLVTNAPVPMERVAFMLERVAMRRDAWDAIISSGDIALAHIAEKGYRRLHFIGPRDRDWALLDKANTESASFKTAEAILCSGLIDESDTAEDYLPLLRQARARHSPFICANPDLVVDVGGRHYICAGAIADLYENMGGEVFWAGKPHLSAYNAACAVTARLRGAPVDPARILVIGDSVRTDIAGAKAAGVDALFVASGIHRDEISPNGEILDAQLARLFAPPAPPAIAAMRELAW